MNSMKRQNDRILKEELPRLVGAQYATGEEWRAITNSSNKNEAAGSKQKCHSAMDVPRVGSGMKAKSNAAKNNIA